MRRYHEDGVTRTRLCFLSCSGWSKHRFYKGDWFCLKCDGINTHVEDKFKEKLMTTELEKLQAEHEAMGKTIARLQEEAKKQPANNKAAMFMPSNQPAFYLSGSISGYNVVQSTWSKNNTTPKFKTSEHAEAIAFARKIDDLMRTQPGIVTAENNKQQWVVSFGGTTIDPIGALYLSTKQTYGQFGVFDTQENCRRAIKNIGNENLIKAANAKIGIY